MSYWSAISNLGDIAITAPLAAGIAVLFAIGRAWRLSLWWALLFFVGLLLVLISKLAFIGWGIGYQTLDFTGLSGHAMRAMAIFPVLGYLLTKKISRSGFAKICAFFIFGGAALIVGISRLILHVHSWSEVFSGWLIGAAVSASFIFLIRNWKNISTYSAAIVLGLASTPLLLTPYIEPTPTQSWLTDVALYLSGHEQAFTRESWNVSTAREAAGHRAGQMQAYPDWADTSLLTKK